MSRGAGRGNVTIDNDLVVSGAVSVSNLPTTQAVSGNVTVGNFPVTQPVSGTVATTSAANTTATGTIDAAEETVECTVSPGASTVGCQLTGTWAAAGDLISFEGTVDGTNWTSIYANLTSVGSLAVTISGSNGVYQIAAAGMVKVRVRGSTWGTPGSCTVSFNSSVGSSASLLALPLPVGVNYIGQVGTKTALTASAPAAVSVGIASAEAVAINAARKGLLLVNTSANYISIAFGAAAVLYSGITLNPSGGSFWMDEYSFSTAQVRAIASGAASNLAVQEFT
jgi:hypothetical protein